MPPVQIAEDKLEQLKAYAYEVSGKVGYHHDQDDVKKERAAAHAAKSIGSISSRAVDRQSTMSNFPKVEHHKYVFKKDLG